MIATLCRSVVLELLIGLSAAGMCMAQDDSAAAAKPDTKLPVIADEPKTIDPATFLPKALTTPATCDLSDSSLNELIDWLREKQGIVVLLNKQALADIGILPGEPISDHLDNDPIYFLLDRLDVLNLGWYYDDGIVHIESADEVESRLTTTPHNIGDLLDAGYATDELVDLIERVVDPTTWDSVGGAGALSSLGDVLFVRQTDRVQHEVEGLLAALRKHARMTFTFDPPRHEAFRQKLKEKVSVDFRDTPLETAVETLAEKAAVDIRLDRPSLRAIRVREREPITLTLNDCKLETVLQAMLVNLDLTWILRDGVLWVTSKATAESFLKTAVYDVRDLCRDEDESESLRKAITSQAAPSTWDDAGGPGAIQFAGPGTMVVLNEEHILLEVLDLLETYRTALRSSKPRDRDAIYDQEVITVYYRMNAAVADDLVAKLPELVKPDSWQDKTRPKAPGKIVRVSSPPEVLGVGASANATETKGGSGGNLAFVAEQAVLIITQTRAVHREIADVIGRVETGDPRIGTGLGGAMGGAGFGGGYFSLPPDEPNNEK